MALAIGIIDALSAGKDVVNQMPVFEQECVADSKVAFSTHFESEEALAALIVTTYSGI